MENSLNSYNSAAATMDWRWRSGLASYQGPCCSAANTFVERRRSQGLLDGCL